jgi:uncharacterized protein
LEFAGFEWDEAKAVANLQKHGIDFADAIAAFDGPMLVTDSVRSGEARKVALGSCDGAIVAIVFVLRDERIRLISVRHARSYEREAWNDRFSKGPRG